MRCEELFEEGFLVASQMFSCVSHTSGKVGGKFVVSVCSREGFVFLKRNLDTGTDETIVGRNGICHV